MASCTCEMHDPAEPPEVPPEVEHEVEGEPYRRGAEEGEPPAEAQRPLVSGLARGFLSRSVERCQARRAGYPTYHAPGQM